MSQTEDEICERLAEGAVKQVVIDMPTQESVYDGGKHKQICGYGAHLLDGCVPHAQITGYDTTGHKFEHDGREYENMRFHARKSQAQARHTTPSAPSHLYLELMGADLDAVPYGETL